MVGEYAGLGGEDDDAEGADGAEDAEEEDDDIPLDEYKANVF